jgi:site-specific DNA recombinase
MSKGARNSAVAEAVTVVCDLYLRLSDGRRENGTFADREASLREKARYLGWTVRKVVIENDEIGHTKNGNTKNASAFKRRKVRLPDGSFAMRVFRPGFRSILASLASREINGLLAEDLDRVMRDPRDNEDLIDVVRDTGAWADSLSGSLKFTAGGTDAEIMQARILVTVANKASADTSRRVGNGRARTASKGKLGGGRRGYGHGVIIGQDPETDAPVWNYNKVNEAEAKEIRALVDAVLAKASLRGLVADLNERAVPTVTGAQWSARTLRDLLTSPRIAGIIMHKGKEAAYNEDLAIITREQHDAVIEVLGPARNHTRATPAEAHGVAYRWLGTGLFRCPCGLTMDVHKRPGNRASVYRCRSNRNAGATAGHSRHHVASLDAYVTEWVLRYLARPGVVEALMKPKATVDLAALRAERAGLTAKLDGLAYAFATDQITLPQLTTATETVKARLAAIDKQLAAAVQTSPLAPLLGVEDVRAAWEALPLEVRRLILDELVTVTVAPNPTRSRRFDRGRITVTAKG